MGTRLAGAVALAVLAGACEAPTAPSTAVAPASTKADAPAPTPAPPDPAPPPPPLRAIAIAAGGQTSYALMSDGTVRGWGSARRFALGRADTDLFASPMAIADVDRAVALAVGGPQGATACVIRDDASVLCWGDRETFPKPLDAGVAGASPMEIPTLAGAREIAIGGSHGCVRLADGSVKCWGELSAWATNFTEPRAVEGLADVVAVRASGSHVCALAKAGEVWCFGLNLFGAVATLDGPGGSHGSPLRADELPPALEIAVTNHTSFSRHADGTVRSWGIDRLGEVAVEGKPIAFARGGTAGHMCVVVEGGGVRCAAPSRTTPKPADARTLTAVSGLPPVTEVATAFDHTCALANDGNVWCWGGNGFGQLGDGSVTDRATPVQVEHLLDRELPPPATPVEDTGPVDRFEGLPPGCRAGSLQMSVPELPRPRFDTKFASASVDRESIFVWLRDHGFDPAKGFAFAPPRGRGLVIELSFERNRVTERRIRNPQPWDDGNTESVSKKLPVTVGTYITFPAWLALEGPTDQRKVIMRLTASDGPILLEASPVREDDVQEVELSHIGPDWVCGTITMASERGEVRGDFAARVRK